MSKNEQNTPLYPDYSQAPSYQATNSNVPITINTSGVAHTSGNNHPGVAAIQVHPSLGESSTVEATSSDATWYKYLGPHSNIEEIYNSKMHEVHVDFNSTFPSLTSEETVFGKAMRNFNTILYKYSSEFLYGAVTVVFGVVLSIFCGLMMGLTRGMFTYGVGPLLKWMNIFVSAVAPAWRAFFRAAFDPFFESMSLGLSNIQVRMGMEANARHKAIKP